VVGETVNVVSLTKMPIYPWPGVGLFYGLGWVHLQGFAVTGEFDEGAQGGTGPFVIQCILDDEIFVGSPGGANVSNLYMSTAGSTLGSLLLGNINLIFGFNAFLNTVVLVEGSQLNLSDVPDNDLTLQSAQLVVQLGSILSVEFQTADFGVFDNAAVPLQCGATAQWVHFAGNVYGSGNSTFIFGARTGSKSALPKAGMTAGTSTAHPLLVAGVSHDYADLPIADLTTGTFVND